MIIVSSNLMCDLYLHDFREVDSSSMRSIVSLIGRSICAGNYGILELVSELDTTITYTNFDKFSNLIASDRILWF